MQERGVREGVKGLQIQRNREVFLTVGLKKGVLPDSRWNSRQTPDRYIKVADNNGNVGARSHAHRPEEKESVEPAGADDRA